MAIVLLIRPAGLFGQGALMASPRRRLRRSALPRLGLVRRRSSCSRSALAAPFVVYPVFLMKALCFALFACAFNLLLGYAGLLSFGHAAFFGGAAYVTGHSAKVWGLPPELGDPRRHAAAAAARPGRSAGSRSAARASTSR